MRTAIALAVLACALLRGAHPVHAQERSAKGTVVRIDDGEVILDLGRAQVREGEELDVYRAVTVRHPVTGQQLQDRFVIARLRVVQAGEALSLATAVGEPSRAVAAGDAVEGKRRAPAAPSAAEALRVEVAEDPEMHAALEAWRRTLGLAPEARVEEYQKFLQKHPGSRFAPAVKREVGALLVLAKEREAMLDPHRRRAVEEDKLARAVLGERLRKTREGQRTAVAVAVDPDAPVRSVLLYVRPVGGGAFERVPMTRDPSGHARADVPPEVVQPPEFQYFVVAVDRDGRAMPVLGSAEAPVHVEVEALDVVAPEGKRSRVRFSTEVVSFDGTSGRDYMVVSEGDFLYRTLYGALYGVRVGYGHLRGSGAPLSVLDAGGDPDIAAFTYGFFEIELRLHHMFAVMARTTVGLGQLERDELDQSGLRGGFQLRVRIGPERGTNLVLAGESIPEIGQRAFIGLSWEAVDNWPMAAEVHVTDQPVASQDLGVRGVLEAGRRFGDVATLSARLSFQGRRIDHSGFGAGLAATFDW
jgi:hypothetical protein